MWRIDQCRWLSTTQIKREFFTESSMQAVNKRLKILTDAGYLYAHQPSPTEECYFRLARLGKTALMNYSDTDNDQIQLVRNFPKQLKHFSSINDIRWFCEKSIAQIDEQMKFFFCDYELKGLLQSSTIIPDALLCFEQKNESKITEMLFAIEYDAGTENPRYFGRDKVKKYHEEYADGNALFQHSYFKILVFADTRQRVLSLFKSSLPFLDGSLSFYFAALDDLQQSQNIFDRIYISQRCLKHGNENILCAILD